MNFDRKSIAALCAGALFFVAYEQYLNRKYPDRHRLPASFPVEISREPVVSSQPSPVVSVSELSPPVAPALTPEECVLENPWVRLEFDPERGSLRQVLVKTHTGPDYRSPHELLAGEFAVNAWEQSFAGQRPPAVTRRVANRVAANAIRFTRDHGNFTLAETWQLGSTHDLDITLAWTHVGPSRIELSPAIELAEERHFPASPPWYQRLLRPQLSESAMLSYSLRGSAKRTDMAQYCNPQSSTDRIQILHDDIDYFGSDDTHFLRAVSPQVHKLRYQVDAFYFGHGAVAQSGCQTHHWATFSYGSLAPGETAELKLKAWFGPKDKDQMAAASELFVESLDLGFFSRLARVFSSVLAALYGVLGNWGAAIIVLTVSLRVLLYPTLKPMQEMSERMREAAPELERIKNLYGKSDPQRLVQEQMALYRRYKIKPASGCLPPLLQIPIFISFFALLRTSVHLRHAPFVLWIHDLAAPDPYLVLPLIYGFLSYLQQQSMPTGNTNPEVESIMKKMPIFFSFFMVFFPAGVALYSVTNALMMVLQQAWLKRVKNRNQGAHAVGR